MGKGSLETVYYYSIIILCISNAVFQSYFSDTDAFEAGFRLLHVMMIIMMIYR